MRDEAAIWLGPGELKPWPKNPRRNGAAIAKVVRAIERFGFGPTVTARRANLEIIAGHSRVEAAKRLGLERIPVRLLDLSEADAHAMAIADNRIGEEASWNAALLRDDLESLAGLDDLGFEAKELARILEPDQPEIREIDTSDLRAQFFLSVAGPLPQQPAVLDALKKALLKIPGLDVQMSVTDI